MTSPASSAAFEAFYRAEHALMLRYFRKRVGRDAAPDLVQEAFTRMLRSGAFERVEYPGAYLTRIAHNLLLERARRKMRESPVFFPFDEECDAPVPPEQTWGIEAADLQQVYRRTLRAMPRKTRRIFLMNRLRHLTYKEIEQQLGIGDKAVQYHMMRALTRCRRAIAASR